MVLKLEMQKSKAQNPFKRATAQIAQIIANVASSQYRWLLQTALTNF